MQKCSSKFEQEDEIPDMGVNQLMPGIRGSIVHVHV